jgi:hypothetical protein
VKDNSNDRPDVSASGPVLRHLLNISVMDILEDYYMI